VADFLCPPSTSFSVTVFSPVPVAIPQNSFPELFLVACCHGKAPTLVFAVSGSIDWGVPWSSPVKFSFDYRGLGHWAVSLLRSDGRPDACYLTEHGAKLLSHDGAGNCSVRE
jgi:hypothetical protein